MRCIRKGGADLEIIDPEAAAFMLCIEGTEIEHQSLLLCESIRRFAGQYRNSKIVAICPRPEIPISDRSRARLTELAVDYFEGPLNQTNSPYLPINRIVAGAWAEANLANDYIVVLDSDTLFVREPIFYRCDVGARPVDAKGATSTGPDDPQDAYWRYICEIGGIAIDDLPWLTTTVDGIRIRASYNAGFTVAKRERGVLKQTEHVFFQSLRADMRPLRGRQANVFASTGHVGFDASEFWGSSQAALSVAFSSCAEDLLIYSPRYNVPLHIGELKGSWCDAARDPVHVHYHWLARPESQDDLLNRLGILEVSGEVKNWLHSELRAKIAA